MIHTQGRGQRAHCCHETNPSPIRGPTKVRLPKVGLEIDGLFNSAIFFRFSSA